MTNAWTRIADATRSIAVTVWNRPVPPAMSDGRCRRAPAIDAANAPLARTNAARIRNVPSEDMKNLETEI